MWISAIITLVGVIIQAASQNIAMFVVARFIVGIGNGATFICGPIYLAEIFPLKWRGIGLALFMDFFYVGKEQSTPLHLSSILSLTNQLLLPRWTSLLWNHVRYGQDTDDLGLAAAFRPAGSLHGPRCDRFALGAGVA